MQLRNRPRTFFVIIAASLALAGSTSALCASARGTVSSTAGAVAAPEVATDSAATMIARILDKWQGVSSQLEQDAVVWREQFSALLKNVSPQTLAIIDRMGAFDDAKGTLVTSYQHAVTLASLDLAKSATAKSATASSTGLQKLGSATTDLIFVPVPPCRIVDTRNIGAAIPAGNGRSFYFYAPSAGYSWASQGGVGGVAASVCPLTVLSSQGGALGNVAPAAAMATVTATGPSAAGNFIVWGGNGAAPTSSVLNFTAGQTIANTTVLPSGGRVAGTLDFAVALNGSGFSDVIVDVVGYFVENAATALDCTTVINTGSLTGFNDTIVNFNACPAGYTRTGANCNGAFGNNSIYLLETGASGCSFRNLQGSTATGQAEAICCRVPGR